MLAVFAALVDFEGLFVEEERVAVFTVLRIGIVLKIKDLKN